MAHKVRGKQVKPSATAAVVAAATAYIAGDPRLGKLVPPEAVPPTLDCLRAAGLRQRMVASLVFKPWFRRQAARRERRLLPGLSLHIAVRKRYVEAAVRSAAAEGYSQLVVLGAGYDTLALRLHREFPKLVCIELDRAATQRLKLKAALAKDLPANNLGAVPCDFATDELGTVLSSCPIFRAPAPTVFVAEAVFMYMPDAAVRGLLSQIRELGSKRARLVFTFVEPLPGGGFGMLNSDAAERWLERRGEPMRSGISRDALPKFLADQGWSLVDTAGPQTFRKRFLSGLVSEEEPLAAGEYGVIAERT